MRGDAVRWDDDDPPEPDESGLRAGRAVLDAVDQQLRWEDPPEAKEAYDRLIAMDVSDDDARRYIACALVAEVFEISKYGREYDQERYAARLRGLPDIDWD